MARSTKTIAGDETMHYVSPRKKREAPKAKMQPPMTPMIDVTFQLLLFFLLTMTFREAEGIIPGTLPAEAGTPQTDPIELEKIEISLRPAAEGCLYEIRGLNVGINSPAELYARLKARQDAIGSADAPVIIKPSPDVGWEFVVEAFNQAMRAEFKNIGFATSS